MDLAARLIPCASFSQAATCPAVRQRPLFNPAFNSACTLGSPIGLVEPGGVSRRSNSVSPPAKNLFSQRAKVLGEQPTICAMSRYPCWPVVASRIACRRCRWRTSSAALNRCSNSALRAGGTVSLRCARAMPLLSHSDSKNQIDCYEYCSELVLQEVGRGTPCAAGHDLAANGAHGVTRPA